jgi:hypothetical protein
VERTDAGSTLVGKIEKLAVSAVPVKQAGLFKVFGGVSLVYLGIHMPVGNNQVFPAIVIEVEKSRAPSQVFGIYRKTGGYRIVLKNVLALIAIEGVGIVGKICLEDVE